MEGVNVVHVNHKKHMKDPFVVHVFFMVYVNHNKHMMEGNVVYVVFKSSHKPPKTMYAGLPCPHVCVVQHTGRIKSLFMCFSGATRS